MRTKRSEQETPHVHEGSTELGDLREAKHLPLSPVHLGTLRGVDVVPGLHQDHDLDPIGGPNVRDVDPVVRVGIDDRVDLGPTAADLRVDVLDRHLPLAYDRERDPVAANDQPRLDVHVGEPSRNCSAETREGKARSRCRDLRGQRDVVRLDRTD